MMSALVIIFTLLGLLFAVMVFLNILPKLLAWVLSIVGRTGLFLSLLLLVILTVFDLNPIFALSLNGFAWLSFNQNPVLYSVVVLACVALPVAFMVIRHNLGYKFFRFDKYRREDDQGTDIDGARGGQVVARYDI